MNLATLSKWDPFPKIETQIRRASWFWREGYPGTPTDLPPWANPWCVPDGIHSCTPWYLKKGKGITTKIWLGGWMLGVPKPATQNFDYSALVTLFWQCLKMFFLCDYKIFLQNHKFGGDIHSRILDCGDASPIPTRVGILAIALPSGMGNDTLTY